MKTIEITLREDFDLTKIEQTKEIFDALVRVGGLTGVRGGKTIIHFDGDGVFQQIQLDYVPFRRKKKV